MNQTTLETRSTVFPRRTGGFTAWSPRTAALIAGVALAFMAVLGGFANFGALVPLMAPGDAAQTAQNIAASPLLFLLGVASFVVVAVLDILVARALYLLFRPVGRRVSAAAAWLRTVYALLLMVAISRLLTGYSLLGNPENALPVLESFTTIWVISLGLFGISLVLVGYLAFRSGFMAKVFGVLLAIAGVGYIMDAISMIFIPDFTAVFAQFMFAGEVAIIFWLLINGRRLSASAA